MSTCLNGGKTIVATMNRSIREAGSLEIVLKSIFPDARFNDLRNELASHLPRIQKDNSYHEIHSAAVEYVSERLAATVPDISQQAVLRTALSQLHSHFAKANDSETAYNPKLKPNPQAVFWPNPAASGHSVFDELPFVAKNPLIDRRTPIGSAGSCFASEIAEYLKANGYNYVVTEENDLSCAAWGALYNTPSFRQLAEFAFGLRQRPRLIFSCDDTGKTEYWDPFREGVFFQSVAEYEESCKTHLQAARAALMQTKVFVMTVGLNEIWRLTMDDSVLARYPRTLASHLVYKQILTVEQNVHELQRFLDVTRAHNPDLQIIITVSPVPLYATFRADECHVVTATCHSKAVLRVAVEEFARLNPGIVHYFPAYEVVNYCSPNPWIEDGRHVSRDTVAKVMRLFEKTFLDVEP